MSEKPLYHALRSHAEKAVLAGTGGTSDLPTLASLEQAMHELRVHQAELEMQNEELRFAEMRTAQARDRYCELYDFALAGYLVLDSDWRITEANKTAAALLGVDRTRLLRTRLTRYLTEAECDSFHCYLQKLKQGAELPPFEAWFKRADSQLLRAMVKVQAIQEGFRLAILDITKQRSVEDQLHRKTVELGDTSQRLRQIAKIISDVFYTLDLVTGKLLYISDAFEQVFERQEDEGLRSPQRWLPFVHKDDLGKLHQAWQSVKGGGQTSFDLEYRVIRPDGVERLVRDRGFVDVVQRQVAGILQDVTEERALEGRLRQAQRMESLGTSAAGIAHDFNNLLMGIAGYLHVAKKHLEPSDKALPIIEQALKSVVRGSTLAKQLVSFSDERPKQSRATLFDDVIIESADLLRTLVGHKVDIEVQTNARGISVAADPGEMEQFLMNLGSNARDAMPTGGMLTIKTGTREVLAKDGIPGRYATVAFTDTGCGMSEETRSRIFEPFFTTKAVGEGTGLGLSTVLSVLRRLNGFVTVDSELGKGTTVTVALPIVSSDYPRAHELQIDDSIKGRGETVLLVDDDREMCDVLGSYLSAQNYNIVVAHSSEEADVACEGRGEKIRLLICDVMMPGTLGTDFAPKLQQRHGNLPVLFISAHSPAELLKHGHVTAETRLLTKPFNLLDLGMVIRRILDATGDFA